MKNVYGRYALVKESKSGPYASFRSPLRKFWDLCVLRQLESMSSKMEVDIMTEWVCRKDKNEFLKLFKL